MKKHNFLYMAALCIAMLCNINIAHSQSTSAGAAGTPNEPNAPGTDYVGWDNTVTVPLEIKHEADTCINFYTNAGAGTFNNIKMSIMKRTINGTERAGVGIHERGTSRITLPRSILHLGSNYFGGGIAGWRKWMDVGTFTEVSTDFAFFGIMPFDGDTTDTQGDHDDAVVAWGDNLTPVNEGADNLRFIFSGLLNVAGQGNAAGWAGLEVARITSFGRMGIGNFTPTNPAIGGGSGVPPARKLEIYGENLDSLKRAANPQLRLTYTPASSVNIAGTGKWVDQQATNLGDLYIHPSADSVDRRVGINVPTPGNTLEINSPGTYSISTTGSSGLRFTDMRKGSLNNITSYGHVLTVDTLGDVVLTDDVGGGNVIACSTLNTSTDLNYITKWTNVTTKEICRTAGLYESSTGANNVGIGVGTTPPFKLTVQHSIAFGDTGHIYQQEPGGNYYRAFSVTGGSNGYSNFTAGRQAGPAGLMTGIEKNTFVGNNTGTANTTSYNTFVGYGAGSVLSDAAAINNIFLGYNSAIALTTGYANLMEGAEVAPLMTTGIGNTCLGRLAAENITSGNNNTFVGLEAGIDITTGNNNTMLGTRAGPSTGGGRNLFHSTALGYGSIVNQDTCVIIGSSVDHVGIGSSSTVPDSTRLYITAGSYHHAFTTNGDAYINSVYMPSDANIKSNIQPAPASNFLDNLNVYSYTFNHAAYPQLALPAGPQLGVMANEVAAFAPQLVEQFGFSALTNDQGVEIAPKVSINAVNYIGLIPYMLQTMKEQKAQIAALTDQINGCCAQGNRAPSPNSGSIELENLETLQLLDADPNPFSESTMIRWNIPNDFNEAMLYFYDNSGNQINKYQIHSKGAGELQIFGSKLSSGIYNYTLIVDNHRVDSKKLIKAK
jgi:hypothetical protein